MYLITFLKNIHNIRFIKKWSVPKINRLVKNLATFIKNNFDPVGNASKTFNITIFLLPTNVTLRIRYWISMRILAEKMMDPWWRRWLVTISGLTFTAHEQVSFQLCWWGIRTPQRSEFSPTPVVCGTWPH